MFDSNQAFALRNAVEQGHAPLFYRGAVEESMNRLGPARKHLRAVLEAEPHSKDAEDAREMLANMEFRNGQYREALAEIEAARDERPDSADVNNMLPLFRALAEAPDMQVVRRKSTRLMRVGDNHRSLPVMIDGKEVTYGFDTGAALSVIGVSDARMLGLTLKHVDTKLSEASGTAVPGFDVAIAKDLAIGGLHLRSVPFFVLQDTQERAVGV
jgi:tetratricopeptide (TPR) repeat protein